MFSGMSDLGRYEMTRFSMSLVSIVTQTSQSVTGSIEQAGKALPARCYLALVD